MKSSIVATMLIALVFSGPTHSQFLDITNEDGASTVFGQGIVATFDEKGKIEFLIEQETCWFWNHEVGEYTKALCKKIKALFKRMRAEMMQGMSEQNKALMASVSEGPSPTRRLDDQVVAGYRVECRETGQWGETVVCGSKEVYDLIVKTVGRDPSVWMKDLQMDNEKSDPWEKNRFVMSITNLFRGSGLNSLVLASMPKQECERLIKEAKQRKPPPESQVASVKKETSVEMDLHKSYIEVDAKTFFMRGMAGAGTGVTKSRSTDRGTVLEGLEIPKKKKGDQEIPKGLKARIKAAQEAAKKALKQMNQ